LDHHPLSLLLVVEIVEMEMEMEKRDFFFCERRKGITRNEWRRMNP
jgi:hypothetical protein